MSLFWRNILSSEVVKGKSDKLMKRALRDARRKIKKDELIDRHSFALYLQTIDARYSGLKNGVTDATRVINYTKVRADKMAETSQLLDFFAQDNTELARLYQIVVQKAKQADRTDDLKQEKLSPVDISKLKEHFALLSKNNKDK